jgi:hypothetical protein
MMFGVNASAAGWTPAHEIKRLRAFTLRFTPLRSSIGSGEERLNY